MQVKTTYKGITKDGIKGIWCGFKPDNITVLEEIYILYPDEGKQLKNKNTEEILSSVILTDDISQDDFEETEIEEKQIEEKI